MCQEDFWLRGCPRRTNLRESSPGQLVSPVEQANVFDLVVNLRAAKALGLAIPQSILVRADEVIE